jgi:hypothetical protein
MRPDQHAEDLLALQVEPDRPVPASPVPASPESGGSPSAEFQPGHALRHHARSGDQDADGPPDAGAEVADPSGPGARIRVGSPAGILAVVPHLLGFHPSRSLVVLGVSTVMDQVTMAFRYDLPDPPDPELTADVVAHAGSVLARQGIGAAILIGYGPRALVTPVIDEAAGAMGHAGVQLREVLRAEGGRYWSALCHDDTCCPPDGVFYDPCSHPAAVALNEAVGHDAYADRAALARTLEPEPGTARLIRQATSRALRRTDKLLHRAERMGRDPRVALGQAGRDAVRSAIDWYRSGARIADRGRLAFLAVMVADLRVRDDAWALMDPVYRGQHLRLWTDILAGAAPELAPAPAALLAFTAWQCGDGALANVALERALTADPDYSLALLLSQAVQAGIPPDEAYPPMTQDEVAASYGEPVPADPSRADLGCADSGCADPDRADPGNADHDNADPGRADGGSADPGDAGSDHASTGSALSGAGASGRRSAPAEPGQSSASARLAGPRRRGAAA